MAGVYGDTKYVSFLVTRCTFSFFSLSFFSDFFASFVSPRSPVPIFVEPTPRILIFRLTCTEPAFPIIKTLGILNFNPAAILGSFRVSISPSSSKVSEKSLA